MPVVETAPWWRRHPVLTGTAAVLVVALVAAGVLVVVSWLSCGEGMERSKNDKACVGINLAGEKFSPDQPQELTKLVDQVTENNDAITGDNYITIVLLLNMTPVPNVDTASFADVTRSIQGAITAVWRANHTPTFNGGSTEDKLKVKLLLANTGSKNTGWEVASDKIGEARGDHHITAVTGLSQSTEETRRAVAKLINVYQLPVIGASVTGGNMDNNVEGEEQLVGFYRIAPTNSGIVTAILAYIRNNEEIGTGDKSFENVAIVWDRDAGDDYVKTLYEGARDQLPNARSAKYYTPSPIETVTNRAKALEGSFGSVIGPLCSAPPALVFFAGRGADIPGFVKNWTTSPGCTGKRLVLITGDDGVKASVDPEVIKAVENNDVTIRYAALASPDKWGDCGNKAIAVDHLVEGRGAYRKFEAAFTGKDSCDERPPAVDDGAALLKFSRSALATGQAMVAHDAVGLAIHAARKTRLSSVLQNRLSQTTVFEQMKCGPDSSNTMFGASGWIRFENPDAEDHSPTGSFVPMMQIEKDGTLTTVATGLLTTAPQPAGKTC
ncbi:ABC transporter substrate-binding protein [Actinokineospora globicatena]|uniref:ABC-type branched-chain amino acid transport system, substrate-binding protein n=1 Tax=Actinokineospora globicatena TaxID=103729 RepID=A0A9W6V516_9PSEU|nr:hypothetical protein [Actinokineospora globicatena]GLW89840.1 hypothetical protein Aglo03_06560 [Actinokineospora globicatena]